MTTYRFIIYPIIASLFILFTRYTPLVGQNLKQHLGLPKPHVNDSKLSILPAISGFGTDTVAGSGRHLKPPRSRIYRVTTLADSGKGSLRECISLSTPRICLFEVSGEIALQKILRIRNPYITIAGHTAPKPGISVTRGGFSIETHDVLIQHIAIRPGDNRKGVPPRYRDGVSIGAPPPGIAYNIVLDHLSLTWAIDENVSTAYIGTHDVTVANSLIAEGLYDSIHPKGPHSKGVMVGNGSRRITLKRNVISSNDERNPYIKPDSSVEMVNNLVYGWGPNGGWSLCNLSNNDRSLFPVLLTFIGNIYIPAPWSFIAPPIYAQTLAPDSKVYVNDNILLSPGAETTNPWSIASINEYTFRSDKPPIQSANSVPLPSSAVYDSVLATVGSRPINRSPIDRRIINDIRLRRGAIKDCISGCVNAAGPAPTPESKRRPLRLPRSPFADSNGDGYTDIENWLHRIAARREGLS